MAKNQSVTNPDNTNDATVFPTTEEGSTEQFIVVTKFNGSPNGYTVLEYAVGDIVPNDEKPFPAELAAVAIDEGWVEVK